MAGATTHFFYEEKEPYHVDPADSDLTCNTYHGVTLIRQVGEHQPGKEFDIAWLWSDGTLQLLEDIEHGGPTHPDYKI